VECDAEEAPHFEEITTHTQTHTPSPPPTPIHEQEAWNAIQKKHPALPVLFVSAGDDKAMAYAGVPGRKSVG